MNEMNEQQIKMEERGPYWEQKEKKKKESPCSCFRGKKQNKKVTDVRKERCSVVDLGAKVCKNLGLKFCCSFFKLFFKLKQSGIDYEGLRTEPCGTRRLRPHLPCFSHSWGPDRFHFIFLSLVEPVQVSPNLWQRPPCRIGVNSISKVWPFTDLYVLSLKQTCRIFQINEFFLCVYSH